jgi:hypothetical protein
MAPKKKAPKKIQGTNGRGANPYTQEVYKMNAKDPGTVQNKRYPSAPHTGVPAGGYRQKLNTSVRVGENGSDRGITRRVAGTSISKANSLLNAQRKKDAKWANVPTLGQVNRRAKQDLANRRKNSSRTK